MRCKYLEHQACIRTDGQYRMCCISMESNNKEKIFTHTPEEWLQSDTVLNARRQFENNEWPDACAKCKVKEENGIMSMRQKPREYGPGLSHLDLRFGNSCNLGCVMCFPGSSSTIHHEHEKLKSRAIESPWGIGTFEVFNWYTEDLGNMFANLKDLREVYLTGGEPMMVKHLTNFLEKLDSNVELRFNTNGTILNPNVLNELKRFKRVQMCYSIDGIGKINEYIRWGSSWNDIEKNINIMSELSNVVITLGPTIQILNAYYYDELIQWSKQRGFDVYDNILITPNHYDLKNADDRIKERVPHLRDYCNNPSDPKERENFIKYTRILDANRGCNIKDYLPEVASIYGFN